jgi:hypothetical protein
MCKGTQAGQDSDSMQPTRIPNIQASFTPQQDLSTCRRSVPNNTLSPVPSRQAGWRTYLVEVWRRGVEGARLDLGSQRGARGRGVRGAGCDRLFELARVESLA